ncbi:hypothetical protein ACP4OV_005502 [Aristida adscensionis]
MAAARAVRLYFLYVLWVVNATSLAMVVARWAYGRGSRAAAAAERATFAVMWVAGALAPFGAPALIRRYRSLLQAKRRQRQIWGPPKARRGHTGTCGGGPRDLGRVASTIIMLALILVILGRLLQWLVPSKRFYRHKLGSALCDIANLFNAVVMCFSLVPTLIAEMRDAPV